MATAAGDPPDGQGPGGRGRAGAGRPGPDGARLDGSGLEGARPEAARPEEARPEKARPRRMRPGGGGSARRCAGWWSPRRSPPVSAWSWRPSWPPTCPGPCCTSAPPYRATSAQRGTATPRNRTAARWPRPVPACTSRPAARPAPARRPGSSPEARRPLSGAAARRSPLPGRQPLSIRYQQVGQWPGGFADQITISGLSGTGARAWSLAFGYPGARIAGVQGARWEPGSTGAGVARGVSWPGWGQDQIPRPRCG